MIASCGSELFFHSIPFQHTKIFCTPSILLPCLCFFLFFISAVAYSFTFILFLLFGSLHRHHSSFSPIKTWQNLRALTWWLFTLSASEYIWQPVSQTWHTGNRIQQSCQWKCFNTLVDPRGLQKCGRVRVWLSFLSGCLTLWHIQDSSASLSDKSLLAELRKVERNMASLASTELSFHIFYIRVCSMWLIEDRINRRLLNDLTGTPQIQLCTCGATSVWCDWNTKWPGGYKCLLQSGQAVTVSRSVLTLTCEMGCVATSVFRHRKYAIVTKKCYYSQLVEIIQIWQVMKKGHTLIENVPLIALTLKKIQFCALNT